MKNHQNFYDDFGDAGDVTVAVSGNAVQEPFVKATAAQVAEIAATVPSEVRINSVHQDQVGP